MYNHLDPLYYARINDEIWNPSNDYLFVKKQNYFKLLRDKISSIKIIIKHIEDRIPDRKIPESSKTIIYYPNLKRAKKSFKAFEK